MSNDMTASGIKNMLRAMEGEFSAALPKQIPVDRFIRTLMTAIQMRPELVAPGVDQRSLLGSCMRAAQDGLLLDGREAVLNVYNKRDKQTGVSTPTVQYIPMISGILKKVRQSNELSSIFAEIVYANEPFVYKRGDEERIDHEPLLIGERGPVVCVYAIAKTKDGGVWRDVMRVDEVESIRARSPSKNSGPWVTDWAEMAKKTVLRRLGKRLPMSTDLERVLNADQEEYWVKDETLAGGPMVTIKEPAKITNGGPKRLKQRLLPPQETPPAPAEEDPAPPIPPAPPAPQKPPTEPARATPPKAATERVPDDIDDDIDF